MTTEPEQAPKGSRDRRLDQLISWVLGGLATIALTLGATAFSGLQGSIHGLNKTLSSLQKDVTVLSTRLEQYEKLEKRIDNLAKQIHDHAGAGAHGEATFRLKNLEGGHEVLKGEHRDLEGRVRDLEGK